ncbi:MAG: VCBS repeat-containing protein [Runella sp.]
MESSETGIVFRNDIFESDSLNVLSFEYIYNGGGVGIGDLNNDGKPDVFLAGNMVSSRLYLNESEKGKIKFKDITEISKTATNHWCTGVSMIDINQDGWLDIYVLTAFPQKNKPAPNLLFLNEGLNADSIPTFREVAAEVGLADSSYATQATFFDFDLDGDLDVYLCNNAHEDFNRNELIGPRADGTGNSQDKLFRNDSTSPPTPLLAKERSASNLLRGGVRFTDISRQAGILHEGWGLGVVVKDFNTDGWPDIYVANDFQSNDILYINQKNGTFKNEIAEYFAHQSHNSMGVDMADFNNDGLEDLCVVDMLPDDNLRQKTMFPNIPHDKYRQQLRMGYQPQFVRNVLQLNNGAKPQQPYNPTFSDIGYLAGIAATDWSWSPLFADFDMDGWRDLLITNGYVKDITDLDFMSYSNEYNMFGSKEERSKRLQEKAREIGEVKKPNWLFINQKDLTFQNKAAELGLKENTFTNGTAYADFDNDGDLDIIMNNLNDEVFIYQNNQLDFAKNSQLSSTSKSYNYLKIKLLGNGGNLEGLNSKITIWYNGQSQFAEHIIHRGYLSTVENFVYFGLGQAKKIDSLEIQWLSAKRQVLKNVAANQTLLLEEKQADLPRRDFVKISQGSVFKDITQNLNLDFVHEENEFLDFNYQPTLPHLYSTQGPHIAVGDINGDGLEDFYAAGASRHTGYFFVQTKMGFVKKPLLQDPSQKRQEETGVLLFDADADGDLDLYCVAGGSEFGDEAAYQDMLYLNDGKGNFAQAPDALPKIISSGSCVVAGDFDQDGDLDLFVGGRVVPKQWPKAPRSYLLRNETSPPSPLLVKERGAPNSFRGGVRFSDVTAQLCPESLNLGMITAATWQDLDNDRYPELVLVGEWLAPTFFKNQKGKLSIMNGQWTMKNGQWQLDQNSQTTNASPPFGGQGGLGWWHSLSAADFDNDGDVDFVLGNLGLNSRYKASPTEPIVVHAKDFDHSGSYDAFMSIYIQGKPYLNHPRGTILDQMPSLKRKMVYYREYGKMDFQDLFNPSDHLDMQVLQATQMASVYLENEGNGKFSMKPLPTQAQIAPIQSMLPIDVNHDGHLDLVAVGNSFATESLTGRYDASQGWVMLGDGKGNFQSLPPWQSGFMVQGDARTLVMVRRPNQKFWLIAAVNGDKLRIFQKKSHQP